MMSLPAPKPSQSRRILENRPRPTFQQSDWSLNSKETRSQDERYKEKDTDIDRDWFAWQASYSQWNNWRREDEKASSENEEMIQRTKEVLQRHRRKAPVQVHLAHRSGKRGRSPLPQENIRMGRRRRGGKASSKRAKAAEYATLDDKKKILTEVDVQRLRLYSQLSIKAIFQCGRPVMQLVQDLWDVKVKVCAPFLRLSVFETTDPHTNQPILRCIDNRRLYALKQYALLCDDPVTVNFFSESTITEVQRFIQNSDRTDGLEVRMRNGSKQRRNT